MILFFITANNDKLTSLFKLKYYNLKSLINNIANYSIIHKTRKKTYDINKIYFIDFDIPFNYNFYHPIVLSNSNSYPSSSISGQLPYNCCDLYPDFLYFPNPSFCLVYQFSMFGCSYYSLWVSSDLIALIILHYIITTIIYPYPQHIIPVIYF